MKCQNQRGFFSYVNLWRQVEFIPSFPTIDLKTPNDSRSQLFLRTSRALERISGNTAARHNSPIQFSGLACALASNPTALKLLAMLHGQRGPWVARAFIL